MVREAIANAVPPARKRPVRERPQLGPATEFIDGILEADRKAPRKQRHTAHRIWVRLRKEVPAVEVAECTVRRYVRERKRAMGRPVVISKHDEPRVKALLGAKKS